MLEIRMIEVAHIVEDCDQPRKHLDAEALQGLADSIRQHGVLQPITVTPLANVNMYRIVTGERRWRASRLAGLDVMPCVVREPSAEDVITEQLVENLQREDLLPIDKARALSHVKEQMKATNREVASRLGLPERSVAYLLDLLELPQAIAEQVVSSPNKPADGRLTEKHARFIKQLSDDPDLQTAVVERVRGMRLPSEQTGRLVRALRERPDEAQQILGAEDEELYAMLSQTPPARTGTAETEPPPWEDGESGPAARTVLEFLARLDELRPMDLPPQGVRELCEALTSLRMALDGIIRECELELAGKA